MPFGGGWRGHGEAGASCKRAANEFFVDLMIDNDDDTPLVEQAAKRSVAASAGSEEQGAAGGGAAGRGQQNGECPENKSRQFLRDFLNIKSCYLDEEHDRC
jgi:hypothetical protein